MVTDLADERKLKPSPAVREARKQAGTHTTALQRASGIGDTGTGGQRGPRMQEDWLKVCT